MLYWLISLFIMNKIRNVIFYPAFIFIYWSRMSGIYNTSFFCWNLSFSWFILESKHIIFHYIKLGSGKSKIENSFFTYFLFSSNGKVSKETWLNLSTKRKNWSSCQRPKRRSYINSTAWLRAEGWLTLALSTGSNWNDQGHYRLHFSNQFDKLCYIKLVHNCFLNNYSVMLGKLKKY